ncbi:hypothetical protein H9636_07115 [Ureibacillus sp. Re31]|uniref:Uncharacterized protein n=1 Tax=Ureibacillus galli TaxID=2762222 RepID=A0ABR8XB68_9BACL|nr:hypothetical protein [Ureibacillus galli]MBD8026427.1 hypothetical protein [Ureibacillus galli]
MARITVRFRDNNQIPELRRVLNELDRYSLEVGVFAENDTSNPSYVMIANVHEFGVTIQRERGSIVIPERSFIRTTFDEKNAEWVRFIRSQLRLVVTFRIDARTLWERLGAKIVADIQEKITDLDAPPNAPSTIAKKGSSNPLIDTGGLRSRITYRVVRV